MEKVFSQNKRNEIAQARKSIENTVTENVITTTKPTKSNGNRIYLSTEAKLMHHRIFSFPNVIRMEMLLVLMITDHIRLLSFSFFPTFETCFQFYVSKGSTYSIILF